MNPGSSGDNEFIRKLTDIIINNLDNENFGVEELIRYSGLSRNFLTHRLKSIHQTTISQFINDVRLNKAHEFLKQGKFTVSEVAYMTGFSSPEYFIRCFHGFFGFTPGEEKKKE